MSKRLHRNVIGRARFARAQAAIVLVALAALAAGCGDSSPKVPRLDPDAVILAFGDSLTFGTGAGTADSYPAVLERLVGRKVVAAGVPGETSERGLARLPDVLEDVDPRLLILCHGGNDFLQRRDDAAAADNIRAMVRLARARGVAVVLLATPKPGFGITVPAFYAEIGREFGIPVENATLAAVLSDRNLRADFVHPNAEGYARIADAMARLLRAAGAL